MGMDASEVEDRAMRIKILIIFCLFLVNLLSSCGDTDLKDQIDDSSDNASVETNILEKFNYVKTERGKRIWDLSALRAVIYKERGTIEVYNLKVNFYEEEVLVSTLKADNGILYQEKGDMEIEKNVEIVSYRNQTRIQTETLFWSEESRKINSPGFVREERPDAVVTGYGLEADPGLEKVVIKDRVRVIGVKEKI